MDNIIVIGLFVLVGLAVLIFILWLVIRKNTSSNHIDAARFTEVEIARAKRFGKRVAFIFVEMDKKSNNDFMMTLNTNPSIIREYDVVTSIGNNRYLLIWSDAALEFQPEIIIQQVKKRFAGIDGIKEITCAFYPEDGSSFNELQKNSKFI
ncbi:MAG: hypothetical protein N2450_03280 [bacterium]|nr:hypothetical protein [bacterium]